MEFFWNECREYTPPKQDFTAEWARLVLKGDKKQFILDEVQWLGKVKRDPSCKVKDVYKEAKKDPLVNVYLPDYPEKRLPNRKFLFNIINTVYP